MVSNYNTNHFSCHNCPAKLFNDGVQEIYTGVGNPNSICCIILPTYISTNEILFNEFIHLVNDEYKKRYDIQLVETVYVTPSIKCYCKNANYNVAYTMLEKCAIKTQSEIYNNKFSKFIFLGDAKDLLMYLNVTNYYEVGCPYNLFINENDRETFLKLLFKVL